jgi:CRP-like cAMP-binding protein
MTPREEDPKMSVEHSKNAVSQGSAQNAKNSETKDSNMKVIHVKNLYEGSYFGEVALVTKLKRTTNVTASDFCTLSSLSRDIFK